jgi:predicted ATP-binding protein involved in virulence
MKIRKIHIEDYKIFKDFDLDLTHDGRPLDIVVVAGINGSGKTTLFEFIYDFMNGKKFHESILDIQTSDIFQDSDNVTFINGIDEIFSGSLKPHLSYSESLKPYLSYFKAGTFIKTNAKSSIIEYIDKLIYEEDIQGSKAYQKVQQALNSFFDGFDLQIEFSRLDKKKEVYFKNKYSEKIKINDLSTGEQELITKAFSLYLTDLKDSVILIDEPETSLHPKWQNRILKIYKDFAKRNNNQIIIATHSPHIIASAKKESLRLLVKRGDKIEVVSDFEGSYGYEVQRVLLEIMDLDSLRNLEINKKLDQLKKLVFENNYKSKKFINLQKELENTLGRNDIDLSLLRLEIAKREKMNEKN